MGNVGPHHQVLIDELGRIGVVGMDAAHFDGGQVHLGGLFGLEKCLNGGLVSEVQFCVGSGNDVCLAVVLQNSNDGTANHATVAGDVYFWMLGHVGNAIFLVALCAYSSRARGYLMQFLVAAPVR
jgi:hypothetical protein